MSAGLLIWSFTPQAGASADNDPTEDPDRLPGFQGRFDEGEYLRQRDAFIALLRGVDPNKPFDPDCTHAGGGEDGWADGGAPAGG